MQMMAKILASGAGIAALATAVPVMAQDYYPCGSNYRYNGRYADTPMAAQQCSTAVQQRLNTRIGVTGASAQCLARTTQAGCFP